MLKYTYYYILYQFNKVFKDEFKLTTTTAYMTEKYGFAEKKAFHSEILHKRVNMKI